MLIHMHLYAYINNDCAFYITEFEMMYSRKHFQIMLEESVAICKQKI